MELCSDGHEEVCFEGRNCPVCQNMEELHEKLKELDDYTEQLDDANNKIYELEKEIELLDNIKKRIINYE